MELFLNMKNKEINNVLIMVGDFKKLRKWTDRLVLDPEQGWYNKHKGLRKLLKVT